MAEETTNKKKKESTWFKTKKTFFGVGKEFKKITWPSLKHILWAFVVVFFLTAFLVLLFYIVGDIMSAAHIVSIVNKA